MIGHIFRNRAGTVMQAAAYSGFNESGINPICDKIIVKVDTAVEVGAGVHYSQDHVERETNASVSGVIVAMGPTAFVWDTDRMHRWEGERPQPGDRICFQKYAGIEQFGVDGATYRIMQDKSVAGTLSEPQPQVTAFGAGIVTGGVLQSAE